MKIKKYLRRFVPVSRTYVDAKIKETLKVLIQIKLKSNLLYSTN